MPRHSEMVAALWPFAILPEAPSPNSIRMSRVTLVEYDPFWPSLFDERALSITALLSPFVREVHHIGSTAIPGLAAKPKIDIDAVMVDVGALPKLSARLQRGLHLSRRPARKRPTDVYDGNASLWLAALPLRRRQRRPCGSPALPEPVTGKAGLCGAI